MKKESSVVRIIRKEMRAVASPEKARILQRFFKTGPGEYGEGDIFIGCVVPSLRRIATKYYAQLTLNDCRCFLTSQVHEERFFALLVLVLQFTKGREKEKADVYAFYMKHTAYINNWDLVDVSAAYIVGPYLEHRDRTLLEDLAKSSCMWERRIAMLATFYYIKQQQYDTALCVASLLITDREDLIHKAVGWMLREIGKRSLACEETFLQSHYRSMPRTMLRYAIERFPEKKRQAYLQGTI